MVEMLGLGYSSLNTKSSMLFISPLSPDVLISNWSNLQGVIYISITEMAYIDRVCYNAFISHLSPQQLLSKLLFTNEETKVQLG